MQTLVQKIRNENIDASTPPRSPIRKAQSSTILQKNKQSAIKSPSRLQQISKKLKLSGKLSIRLLLYI